MTAIYESDVCIIGTGPAGAMVATKLAGEGLTIHMVEQGAAVSQASLDDVITSSEPAYVRLENGAWGPLGYPWTTCNIGGGSVFYGAASFRLRRVDFDPARHISSTDIPIDWPIDFECLRPHYDAIESQLGLSGAHPSEDPTHPGGSTPALPPLRQSPQGRRLRAAAVNAGLSPFATPMMIVSEDFGDRKGCDYCSPCIEHVCTRGSKFDAYRHLLAPLERRNEIRIFPNTKAVRLRDDDGGGGVFLEGIDPHSGVHTQFRARRFVLCANAVQTAALLLRSSATLRHGTPAGRQLVGRGLCMKLNEYVVGYPSEPADGLDDGDPWIKGHGPFSTFAVTDYYVDSECPTGLGGLIYETRPGWKYGIAPEDDIARLECLVGDTPSYNNRVRLSSSTDKHGIPELMIDYRPHPQDLARLDWLCEKAETLLGAAGYRRSWREPGGYMLGSSHFHGTCRAGIDPEKSVIDAEGRLHEQERVFIADGSYMPFPGAVNPTLSIQAIASHVADGVRKSLGFAPQQFVCP
ncbi:GMC oxidoreductase [Parerythrobacter aestuarii]|uniref:GMC oxidoreductase n=1 Tax=Parerythrobacter aestuarii TaxID=3020909 RepID=UPI0024DE3823|nr:GMC family oxidoreductase [Parerythrobacter aestuarii]